MTVESRKLLSFLPYLFSLIFSLLSFLSYLFSSIFCMIIWGVMPWRQW